MAVTVAEIEVKGKRETPNEREGDERIDEKRHEGRTAESQRRQNERVEERIRKWSKGEKKPGCGANYREKRAGGRSNSIAR